MAGKNDMISALRGKLSDDNHSVKAFSLAVTANAKSALLEISNGFLIVDVSAGENVSSSRGNLLDPRYSTIGKLISSLGRQSGYKVITDNSVHNDHASEDLVVESLVDIKSTSAEFRHHIWADTELAAFLDEAALIHNPNYTKASVVPVNERPFVLYKATASAYRMLAGDSVRRKGLDADAGTLLKLASDLEEQYRRDLERLRRVVPVPKADESKMGHGDIVQGTLTRESHQFGYMSPARVAGNQQPPRLYDEADDDAEDTLIRIRWSQPREQRFAYMEVWRDTQPRVERCLSGRLHAVGDVAQLSAGSQFSKAGTSKQVFGAGSSAYLSSPAYDGAFFWTGGDLAGTHVSNSTFIDGQTPQGATGVTGVLGEPLEPNTDYYYRLYLVDVNGEILASEVKRYRTKAMRAAFKRNIDGSLAADAISVATGPLAGGTSIVIRGTNFATGVKALLNGKEMTLTVDSATQITATSPAFTNPQWVGRKLDIVLLSPTGLLDTAKSAWSYT